MFVNDDLSKLSLVQLVGELKTLQDHLNTVTRRIENVSHQLSCKIEIAENQLIQDELINQPISKVES
tara:strand:- start:1696 stop:1896 length:201 start_codon:yes stop_codon:yes gene_type:complete